MFAVVLSEFGPPTNLTLTEVPDPVPGPGQVLVDVHLANITFVETQVRAGQAPNPAMLPPLPAILGNGVGGVVTAVGDGADPALVGRRVITTTGGRGGYAELAAVDATGLIDLPPELSLADAVALLADGRTAVGLIRAAALRPGETVLIEAAAGGVGSLLVQLARDAGARVVATAGGPRKAGIAKDLGADVAVDYTATGWADQIRSEVGEIDVVFDGVGGQIGNAAAGLLRTGGRLSSYGMASGSFTTLPEGKDITPIRGTPPTPPQMRGLTQAALTAAATGALKPLIGQRYPLARAADAHAAIASRATVGKTLLLVRSLEDISMGGGGVQ
ncbi:NADPH:quinone reductase [Acrocarpospora pleiomorpha]|uniref:NADPH:quinone reductase n=1 Tax=Acrocarpospora pleiomorpha TaxID=90975 RepID=A0A5M3XGC0_9ACTN|nr:zinc-binding dehydrogenase [Acrocarpospora pleiomorpha]GES19696.1 NADPH:quinone reductase [Acrocarpospora pleiomorpha]